MHYEYRRVDALEVGIREKIVVAEALPYGLLDAASHTEGREIASGARVRKVAGDAELEAAMAVRIHVALAEARGGQLVAERLYFG